MKNLPLNLIIVAMTLGTAWAVRGKFGHEQGAAWAGAIGAVCILLIARRADWNAKVFKATVAAAIGWGMGGMMSYGILVGYGNGTDFINVYYGFLSLFVVGGLYGFIGGGLFGLVLEESDSKKANWTMLLCGMTASGALAYFFFIMQWEWFMTPPRSELWAACFGAAVFLTWFLRYHQYNSALRVAAFSGLGGGFGFAFGNFIKVLGVAVGLPRSLWNVMEYSLGFFGGLGMAYGTFTSKWEETKKTTTRTSNLWPILILVLFIPFVVWNQTFTIKKLSDRYSFLAEGDPSGIALGVQLFSLALILLHAFYVWNKFYRQKPTITEYTRNEVNTFFVTHFGLYILYSFIITAAMFSFTLIEQYLYIVNYAIILALLPRLSPIFEVRNDNRWWRYILLILLVLAVLAFIAIHAHGEIPGAHKRFEF